MLLTGQSLTAALGTEVKYMNRKYIAFTLVVLLIYLQSHALGEQTLAQRLNAPESIRTTVKSNTGKTTIEIEAAVFVPDAPKVPVYAVAPRQYTTEELRAMADAAFGKEAYEGDADFEIEHVPVSQFSSFEHWFYQLFWKAQRSIQTGRTEHPLPAAEMLAVMMVQPDGSMYTSSAHYDVQQVIGEGFYFANNMARQLDRQPQGTNMLLDEAKKVAESAVKAFSPGSSLTGSAILADEIMEAGVLESGSSHREAYVFYFTPMLALPVNYAYGEINMGEFQGTTQSELITVVIDDLGIRSLWFDWPHEVKHIISEDNVLLQFPQMMEIASTLLPLKFTAYERDYREVRVRIENILLGYMRVPLKDNPSAFQMVPVWDFYGRANLERSISGNRTVRWDHAYNSLLTINAMDGTAIDRDYGY